MGDHIQGAPPFGKWSGGGASGRWILHRALLSLVNGLTGEQREGIYWALLLSGNWVTEEWGKARSYPGHCFYWWRKGDPIQSSAPIGEWSGREGRKILHMALLPLVNGVVGKEGRSYTGLWRHWWIEWQRRKEMGDVTHKLCSKATSTFLLRALILAVNVSSRGVREK